MPKPLSHEQVESLQASGVIVPGFETSTPDRNSAIPAGLILRALGSVGLPHSERDARIDADPDELIVPTDISEILKSSEIQQSYLASYESVSKIMHLIGEITPNLNDPDLLSQVAKLKPTFELFASRGLVPEISISPVNRPLNFWLYLAKTVEDSSLNPTEPDPEHPGQYRKVLRHGGLYVEKKVSESWHELTDSKPSWRVEVISGLDRPSIVNITSYGYTDDKDKNPSPELNQLLNSMAQPEVAARSEKDFTISPIQPDIHPDIENYIMHQLSRITQGLLPLDTDIASSWLRDVLMSGYLPYGRWDTATGRANLNWHYAGYHITSLGVRPSRRSHLR